MNLSKFTLLLASALLAAQPMVAAQLTPQQALARVSGQKANIQAIETSPVFTARAADSDAAAFYVFNNSASDGYTIVSASEQTMPILGYTTSGSFDYDNLPPAMKWWLEEYRKQIEYAESHNSSAENTIRLQQAESENDRTDINPIVQSTWNQGSPYNIYCPELMGVKAPTGCVATAMAQIMRYHQWPEKGTGSNSYTYEYTYTSNGQTIKASAQEEMDFSTLTFNWSDMTYSYNNNSTNKQKYAVATLMHACGVSVNMGYGQSASGAQSRNLPTAYITNFNYDKSAFYYERKFFTSAQWDELIYNEIAAGRPVHYSGHNESSGHSFVCDGYQTGGFYHINWGWGGTSDGYFRLSALDPSTQGIGGSASGYNMSQGAVVNIQKPLPSSDYTYSIVSSAGLSTQDGTVSRNTKISLYPNGQSKEVSGTVFYNNSAVAISNVYYGVRIKNRATGQSSNVASFSYSNLGTNRGFLSISFSGTYIENAGDYEVYPAYSLDKGSTWNDVMIQKDAPQYILLTVTDSEIKVSTPSNEANLSGTITQLPGQMVENGLYTVNASVTNSGSYFNSDIYASFLILNSNNTASIAKIGGASVTEIESGSTVDIEIPVNTSDLTAGNQYHFALLAKSASDTYKIISQILPVEITEQGSMTVGLAIENVTNGRVPMNNIRIKGSARSLNGSFCNTIQLVIFENFDDDGDGYVNGVGSVQTEVLNIPSGSTVNFKAVGSITNGQVGRQYYVRPRINGQNVGNPVVFTLGDEETGIETVSADNSGKLAVTPNPTAGFAKVSAGASIKSVAVYSLQGAVMLTRQFDGNDTSVEIDVADLAAGHYLLRALTTDGAEATHLIKK